ncbi:MAG: NosD domain-containing protein [Euryarchaeota archaeon]|nr:NosD domain-containing protein [Euryarchaeota archaeon]
MKLRTIATLVLLATALSIMYTSVASADTIYVPDDYATIQSAVTNANIDDIIIVRDGTYTENVGVGKRLTIHSENGAASCIVNASDPYDHVFEILVDSVVINGFTVQNATGYSMGDWKHAGIQVTDGDHVNISDCVATNNVFGIRADSSYYSDINRNIVRDNTYGIYLASSPYATLTENALSNNRVRNLDTYGTNNDSYWHKHTIDTTNTVNGKPVYYYKDISNIILENLGAGHISLIDCTGATVRGCSVIGCDGLRVISTDDSLIEGNTVCGTDYAIRLLYSDNNIVLDNTANDNSNGIRVQYGGNNWVENNTLKRNQQGVFVEGCDNTTVIDNTIEDSTDYGCWLYNDNHVLNNMIQGSKRYGLCINGYSNLVSGNTIIDSEDTQWSGGISLSGYSSGNLIYNNFFDNPNNSRDDGTSNIWNTTKITGPNIVGGPEIGGNYWGDYPGTDGDRDGFGDTPYNIGGGSSQDHLPLVCAPVTCGDIDGDRDIDTSDLLRLLEYIVTGTQVPACTGDIDGNGHINSLDVRLLMGHINDSTRYPLNCGC